MKFYKDVQGSKESAQPIVIGKDTVYIHTNIRKAPPREDDMHPEIDSDVYIYDEEQYELLEFITSEKFKELDNSKTNKNLIKALQSQVSSIQAQDMMKQQALLELIEVVYGSMEV